MVNLDGFTLTHTYDLVDIPDQTVIDRYLPPLNTTNKMDMKAPKTLCMTVGPDFHSEGRLLQQKAFDKATEIVAKADQEYGALVGRSYGGMIEEYRCDGAEYVLVATGSAAGTTRIIVDKLRADGKKVGMIKVRCYRPFPKAYFESLGSRFKGVGVIDRSISFGFDGTLFSEVKSAMYGSTAVMQNYIVGLGGRDIPKELIDEMFTRLEKRANGGAEDEVQFLGMRW